MINNNTILRVADQQSHSLAGSMRTNVEPIRVLNAPVSNFNSLLKGQGYSASKVRQ